MPPVLAPAASQHVLSLAQAKEHLHEVKKIIPITPGNVHVVISLTRGDVKTIERVLSAMAYWMPEEQEDNEALAESWIEQVYSVRHREHVHSYI
jgi:hypothetical protein